jgi:peroxiredoxin Q/BCP
VCTAQIGYFRFFNNIDFRMQQLKPGDRAPGFDSLDENGAQVSLEQFLGNTVVLYFYPKDNTSGCTAEACDFRDNFKRITKTRAIVLGVSPDSPKSHTGFKKKYDLPFTLVSDESKEIVQRYGVWKEKSMYGRKYMGVERTTFIIDAKGIITHIFPKVKVTGHVDEILNLLK